MTKLKTLEISPELSLPADAVTQTGVVYGMKGQGKTVLGAVLCEELARCGHKFCYLDPIGPGYGLRYAQDGESKGLDILILGGKHGDIPIEPTAGAVCADLVVDHSVNVVIDISRRADGTMWSQGDKIRFTADYFTRLYGRQGEKCQPLCQIVDEAGRFIPQDIPHGAVDIAKCVGAIEQVVELGRNVGIGIWLITQRSARMKKSVSELAECMIAFRTIGPNSVGAIVDWLGEHVPKAQHKEMVSKLRVVDKGQALVVSPGWLQFEGIVKFRMRRTYDASATPTADMKLAKVKPVRDVDLDRYRNLMAETIEKAKADDPRELKRRIVELEKEVKQAGAVKPAPIPEAIAKRVEVPILDASAVNALNRVAAALERATKHSEQQSHGIMDAEMRLKEVRETLSRITAPAAPSRPAPVNPPAQQSRPAPRQEGVAPNGYVACQFQHGKPEGKALEVLFAFPEGCTIGKLALLAGYRVTGGFRNSLATLRTAGLMVGQNTGVMMLTATGIAYCCAHGLDKPLPKGDEQIRYWLAHPSLGAAERKIIEVLHRENRPMTMPELAEACDYKITGGFRNSTGALRTAGVIVGRNTEAMQLNPDMFI